MPQAEKRVLSGIVTCKAGADDDAKHAEATRGVMLAPAEPWGWCDLAVATSES